MNKLKVIVLVSIVIGVLIAGFGTLVFLSVQPVKNIEFTEITRTLRITGTVFQENCKDVIRTITDVLNQTRYVTVEVCTYKPYETVEEYYFTYQTPYITKVNWAITGFNYAMAILLIFAGVFLVLYEVIIWIRSHGNNQ
jgi:hypothetical protein